MGVARVLQFSFCAGPNSIAPVWLVDFPFVIAIILGTSMCILTAIRFIKALRQVYKMKKGFQLNRYMKCLGREGMIYFIVYVLVLC